MSTYVLLFSCAASVALAVSVPLPGGRRRLPVLKHGGGRQLLGKPRTPEAPEADRAFEPTETKHTPVPFFGPSPLRFFFLSPNGQPSRPNPPHLHFHDAPPRPSLGSCPRLSRPRSIRDLDVYLNFPPFSSVALLFYHRETCTRPPPESHDQKHIYFMRLFFLPSPRLKPMVLLHFPLSRFPTVMYSHQPPFLQTRTWQRPCCPPGPIKVFTHPPVSPFSDNQAVCPPPRSPPHASHPPGSVVFLPRAPTTPPPCRSSPSPEL